MHKAGLLTAALEDYLEAIFHLSRHDKAARSRDIAESLDVHKSTVTAALKSLAGMGLINYSPYEAVTLTSQGKKIAEDVVRRHRALQDFFVNILKVDPETAEDAACGMEHSVPRVIVEKLADFAISMCGCPRIEPVAARSEACASCLEQSPREKTRVLPTLDGVPAGKSVMVVSVRGGASVKHRLNAIGLTRGALATIRETGEAADSMILDVRGRELSIGKKDAARIVVQDM